MSEIYTKEYYENYAGSKIDYREIPEIRNTLRGLAESLNVCIDFDTHMDIGCAFGYIVEEMLNLGKSSFGIDISDYAISHADESIKHLLWVKDVGRYMLQGKYDLITCIEVIEHIEPEKEEFVLWNIIQATKKYLYFSSENNPDEPTHINIHPRHYWVGQIERLGFAPMRFNYPYIPHGVLFERVI